jgi:hypothetical protein
MTIKWELSVSDWRHHVVDDHQDYPGDAPTARCGHWLMIITSPRDKSCGKQCQECATAITPTPAQRRHPNPRPGRWLSTLPSTQLPAAGAVPPP